MMTKSAELEKHDAFISCSEVNVMTALVGHYSCKTFADQTMPARTIYIICTNILHRSAILCA